MNIEVNSANDVARYFLTKKSMSQKKIHKLLYFSYSLYLVENNESPKKIENRLFKNTFEAWVHGPVLREIYPIYASYSYKNLYINSVDIILPEKAKSVCDEILENYGDLTADELERMSHNEIAWMKPRLGLTSFDPSNEKLTDLLIYESSLNRFYV